MATMGVIPDVRGFRVIHPLDDVAEQKCSTEGLGKIRMTRAVRVSLGFLRAYLILMTAFCTRFTKHPAIRRRKYGRPRSE